MFRTAILLFAFFLAHCGGPSLTFGGSEPSPAAVEREYRIFIVNSYHPEYFWSAEQSQAVRDALSGLKLVVHEYFMDSKRHPGEEWLAQQKEICLAEIAAFKPDLIFTGDDNATRTIAPHFQGQALPLVFYGVNAEPESYGLVAGGNRQAPGGNITGVLERLFFDEAVSKLGLLCHVNNIPFTRLYLVTDDSYTSVKLFEQIHAEKWKFAVERVFLPLVSTFSQYKSLIDEINHAGNALFVYNLQTLKDAEGRYVDYREVLAWTRARLTIPSSAFMRKYVEEGLMFGMLVSGYNQAFHAALKAKKILFGTPPGVIPIEAPPHGATALNRTTIERLGFKVPLDMLFGAEIFD
ncbi:MAG: hypothetical protein JXR80_07040 [Deltaproteobacteria bacterium]|nr:hypothetical protein [Deltaproteobacteria bacterium]